MAAAPVEDEDTKAAVVTHCLALPELAAAIPGGFHDGAVSVTPARPTMPYCRILCQQGPQPNRYPAPVRSGSGYSDFRKVTLTVTGIKAAVVTAIGILHGRLAWQPRETTDAASNVSRPMVVANASLRMITPLGNGPRFEEDKTRVEGERIWNGIIDYEVWTGRNVV